MVDFGRLMVLFGLVIALAGFVMWGMGRWEVPGLPGDLRYESQHVRVYFPVVSCLVLSLLLTAVLWLWQWLTQR